MKKYFENPELDAIKFRAEDIMTLSGEFVEDEEQDVDTSL